MRVFSSSWTNQQHTNIRADCGLLSLEDKSFNPSFLYRLQNQDSFGLWRHVGLLRRWGGWERKRLLGSGYEIVSKRSYKIKSSCDLNRASTTHSVDRHGMAAGRGLYPQIAMDIYEHHRILAWERRTWENPSKKEPFADTNHRHIPSAPIVAIIIIEISQYQHLFLVLKGKKREGIIIYPRVLEKYKITINTARPIRSHSDVDLAAPKTSGKRSTYTSKNTKETPTGGIEALIPTR